MTCKSQSWVSHELSWNSIWQGGELMPNSVSPIFYSEESPGEKRKTKRIHITFSEEQLQVLQANFQLNSNPSGQDVERIALITSVSKRVTQVWFQNSRDRQKKPLTGPSPSWIDTAARHHQQEHMDSMNSMNVNPFNCVSNVGTSMPMDISLNEIASPRSPSPFDGANYPVDCDSPVHDDPSRQGVSSLSLGDGYRCCCSRSANELSHRPLNSYKGVPCTVV